MGLMYTQILAHARVERTIGIWQQLENPGHNKCRIADLQRGEHENARPMRRTKCAAAAAEDHPLVSNKGDFHSTASALVVDNAETNYVRGRGYSRVQELLPGRQNLCCVAVANEYTAWNCDSMKDIFK